MKYFSPDIYVCIYIYITYFYKPYPSLVRKFQITGEDVMQFVLCYRKTPITTRKKFLFRSLRYMWCAILSAPIALLILIG